MTNRKYTCFSCFKSFPYKWQLRVHHQNTFGCKLFGTNKTWNYSFNSTYPRTFPCTKCGRSFPQYKYLLKHMQHGTVRYKCGLCQQSICNQTDLTKHKLTHYIKKYNCSICGKVFFTSASFMEHMCTAHVITYKRKKRVQMYASKKRLVLK
jgi:uncharacterized C2H2 Zn-finger protein